MLQKFAVEPECLELLIKISNSEIFSNFILVGGTSLALQIGHRNSVDLDFFTNDGIDSYVIIETLKTLGDLEIIKQSKNILITSTNNVKVDFVHQTYPLIGEVQIFENIKFASKEDIAAMKLHAISNRGSKKDFIDLFFLLKYFSLDEMIDFYLTKYTDHSKFAMLKSLTYFEDAESQPQPKVFPDFNWEVAKEKIKVEFLKLY